MLDATKGNRAQAVAKEVATLPRKTSYRSDSADFLDIKERVGGMTPLTAQQRSSNDK